MTQRVYCNKRKFHGRVGGGYLPSLAFCIVWLLAGIPALAQVQTGISGSVADSSGAVIQGARVTVTNDATGVVSKATTSSAGTFAVLGLLPGTCPSQSRHQDLRKSSQWRSSTWPRYQRSILLCRPAHPTKPLWLRQAQSRLRRLLRTLEPPWRPNWSRLPHLRSAAWRGKSIRLLLLRRACR